MTAYEFGYQQMRIGRYNETEAGDIEIMDADIWKLYRKPTEAEREGIDARLAELDRIYNR